MPRQQNPIYSRGKYRLDFLRRSDGAARSPRFYIFWYDPVARREASCSTGTADEEQAILALDRKYLADRGQAPAYCYACGEPIARAEAYLLVDAISDYRLEHGDGLRSAGSVVARLNHVLDFLEAGDVSSEPGASGTATDCAVACGEPFIAAFRRWSQAQPVTWRNGDGEVTQSRARSPATTEESVLQLAAALNHAANAKPSRSDYRPDWRPLPRVQVSRKRKLRVDVAMLADMLGYAAEPRKRREGLHAFLVASICTLARPDAVVDLSVDPARQQWHPGEPSLDLNPFGRQQTRKYRPVVPVLPVLGEWLVDARAAFDALAQEDPRRGSGGGYVVAYHGRPVHDVDRAWWTMIGELDLERTRELGPYVIRHSLAERLRNSGGRVGEWDLKGMLGHARGTTDTYAPGRFPTVVSELQAVLDEIEQRVPGALRRTRAEQSSNVVPIGRRKMGP